MRCNPDHSAFAAGTRAGLSKREYFAAAALQGLMANWAPENRQVQWQQAIAWDAVSVADALIEELSDA